MRSATNEPSTTAKVCRSVSATPSMVPHTSSSVRAVIVMVVSPISRRSLPAQTPRLLMVPSVSTRAASVSLVNCWPSAMGSWSALRLRYAVRMIPPSGTSGTPTGTPRPNCSSTGISKPASASSSVRS